MDWTKEPLYVVQRAALTEPLAAAELARRYALERAPYGTDHARAKVAMAWRKGWTGEEENPWAHGRGGNFGRPLDSAYRSGRTKRLELEALCPTPSDKFLAQGPAA